MVSNLFDSLLSMLLMSIQRGLSSSSASSWGIMSSSSSSNVIISGNTNITDWTFTASNPIYSTIALDSIDNSYVVDEEGGLYKLNVNGILQWKVQVGKSISPPAIFKDNIFISSTDNNIYSLSTNHGKLSWQFDSQSPVYGSPVVDNNMNIYIASQSVFSLSSTGDVQWTTTPTTIPDAFSVGTPALSPTQQSMYVAFSDGNLYALSTGAGSILWTAPVSTDKSIVSTPIVDEDGTIFIVVSRQAVYAYWPNGSLKFSVNLPTRASVAYYENGRTFYAGGLDNVMYAVSSVDGLKSWLSSSSSPFDSTPAVGPDGSVFASGTDGLLHAYSASGNLMWSYNTGNIPSPNSNIYLTSGPVIRSDGVVIVGSSNGNVYAIGYPYQPTSDAVSSSLPPLLTGTNAIVFGTVFSSTFVLAFLVFYTYRLCKRRRGIFFIDGKFRGGRRSIILNPLRLRKPIISNISVPSVSKMSPRSHYKRAAAFSPSPPKSAVSDQFGGAFSVDMSVAFSPSRQLKYDSTVVIDNGASCMRAGFSADEFPESIFPSVVTIDQSANQVSVFLFSCFHFIFDCLFLTLIIYRWQKKALIVIM